MPDLPRIARCDLTPRSPDPGRFCEGLRAKEHLGTLAPLERLGPLQRVVMQPLLRIVRINYPKEIVYP